MNRVSRVMLAVVLSGLPAALVWGWLGRPAQWLATEGGLVLTEGEAPGQFQVVAMFTVVGVVVGLVTGVLVQRMLVPARWQIVLALAAASTAAALLCWQVGVLLGPAPPQEATGLEVLATVPSQFGVDALPAFLVWPLASVLAYTLAFYLSTDGVDDDAATDPVETEAVTERSPQ